MSDWREVATPGGEEEGGEGGGQHYRHHSPLKKTLSNPTGQQHQLPVEQMEPRGQSLPRNVAPPTRGFPSPVSYMRRGGGGGALADLATRPRPPSNVPEEEASEAGSSFNPPPLPASIRGMVPWKEGRKGHMRSFSHGGVTFSRTNSGREKNPSGNGGAAIGGGGLVPLYQPAAPLYGELRPPVLLPSALKKPGHRRVFSHGQIGSPEQMAGGGGVMVGPVRGHARSGSKTDFILPPGHEIRERKRSLTTKATSIPGRQGSHKRHHSRSDSLGGFLKGHSRQASRTESIYTLRQTTTASYKSRIFFWDKKEDTPDVIERKQRLVVPNHLVPFGPKDPEHPNKDYLSNYISTTKYTFLSFIPKNLFEQFHRFANLYFLFIVLLNWVPAINAFGKEISMLPVILVLIVTAIKDLFEDRRRYKSDKRVNNSCCRVFNPSEGRYVQKFWKELRVGDMVHLSNNEKIPADILLLHSSDENGICYIDTQNLDGETNLKERHYPRGLKLSSGSEFRVQELRANLECDAPTTKIYRFHGSLVQPWGERIPVGKDNLLLRECVIKNTDFVEGLVVYAGHESKAMLNNGGPRYKRSKLEKKINTEVVWCVIILFILCLIGAIGSGLWANAFEINAPFLSITDEQFDFLKPEWDAFLAFWTFIIILQIIIPLSLYVTIELTKLSQVYLIHNDPEMYDEVHGKRVECRALNIPEELGQVQYMFCDKTGTLTENKMVFKRCSINGQDFGHNSFSHPGSSRAVIPVNPKLNEHLNALDIHMLVEGKNSKYPPQSMPAMVQEFFLLLAICNTVIVAKYPHRDTMNASGIICAPANSSSGVAAGSSERPSRNSTSFTPLPTSPSRSSTPSPPASIVSTVSSTAGLTGTATPPGRPNLPPAAAAPRRPKFLDFLPSGSRPLSPIHSSAETTPAESPCSTQRSLRLPSLLHPLTKLTFHSNSSLSKASRASTPGSSEAKPIYEAESPDELALVDAAYAYNCRLLHRSPGRLTVSLPGDGKVELEVLHVLPFDSVRKRMSILVRDPVSGERKLYCKGADSNMLPRLARTQTQDEERLEDTVQEHLKIYAQQGLRVLVMASRKLSEEEYIDWAEQHNRAELALDKRDKLLMESYNRIENKMKLVGATGIEDRLQEGVPEAISRLRQAGIVVWVLTGDKQETAINIAHSCRLFTTDMEVIKLNARSRDAAESAIRLYLDQAKNSTRTREKRGLVVDGKTLIYILDKRANLQPLFLSLTEECSAVLGCRATPLQKAYIVKLVKEQLKMHTLAIGDGANDVSMIQTADIGVGISGQEGMQAVMASDFAITRFKFVERLLLVHGHWCYDRLARMVLHFFYKNACFVFVCFWYQLFCGWSGQVMIDQMYLMLFNLLFTSLPPVAVGVFDRDAPGDLLTSQPKLYSVGRQETVYKPYSFWLNMAEALYQSLVLFFLSFGTFTGSHIGIWEFGTLICSQCILVMLVQLGVETKSWTGVHWAANSISVFVYLAFGLSYNAICSSCEGLTNPFMVMQHSLSDPRQYAVLVLTGFLSALPRVAVRVVLNTIQPSDVILAVRQRRQQRNTEKRMAKIDKKVGIVRFFRSNNKEEAGNVSNGTVELSISTTEMTDM